MNCKHTFFLRRLINNQVGAVAVWMALLIPLTLGVAGLVVDIGYAYVCQRELQASTDAAALAAAAQLPTPAYAITAGTNFSAAPGKLNAYPNLSKPLAITNTTAVVTPGCVTITGLPQCGGDIAANAVQVNQSTTIPTFFIKAMTVFGIKGAQSINLSAQSTAVMRGAQRGPYNVAIVMDTTASMASNDSGNCNGTKIQCAEQGAQILLAEFSPCLPGLSSCGTSTNGNVNNAVDEVSLFTFPAQAPGTQLGNDEIYNTNTSTNCSGRKANPGCPDVVDYPDSIANTTLPLSKANMTTLLSQYQVVPLSSNYRTNDASYASGSYPLNPLTVANSGGTSSSPSIVNAVGGNSYFGGTRETGMLAEGGVNTFFAGAIFAAQQYLAANTRTNASNVIVLLSDGDANGGNMASSNLNSNGTYPSAIDQCQQAIDVANAAKAAGTNIYVVGYGVDSGGCSTDGTVGKNGKFQQNGLTACKTLQSIASDSSQFFVDTSSKVRCAGASNVTMDGKSNTLSAIFSAIAGDLTRPHLISNSIAFTAVK